MACWLAYGWLGEIYARSYCRLKRNYGVDRICEFPSAAGVRMTSSARRSSWFPRGVRYELDRLTLSCEDDIVCSDLQIDSMKFYSQVERIYNELRELGIESQAPLEVDVLCEFDQYHFFGTDAVDEIHRAYRYDVLLWDFIDTPIVGPADGGWAGVGLEA